MVRLPWIEGSAVAILLAGLQQRWNGEDSAPFFFFFFFFFFAVLFNLYDQVFLSSDPGVLGYF